MSYISKSLNSRERIRCIFKLHFLYFVVFPMFRPIVLFPAMFVIMALDAYAALGLSLLVSVAPIPLMVFLVTWISYKCSEYGMTNLRVITKRGFIRRHTEEMRLSAIETIEIQQGVWQRLLGAGHIKVSGMGVSEVVLKHVAGPMAVKRMIEEECDLARRSLAQPNYPWLASHAA